MFDLLVLTFAALSVGMASLAAKSFGCWCAMRAQKREHGEISPSPYLCEDGLLHLRFAGIIRVSLLAAFFAVALLQKTIVCGIAVFAMGFLAICAIESDVGYGYIPKELSGLLGIVGLAFQGADGDSLVFGLGFGFLTAAVSQGLRCLARKKRGIDIVGGGDIRMMLSLGAATGFGSLAGFFFCYAFAVLWMLAAKPRKGVFPMAPFFSVWLLVGLVTS